MTRLTVFIERMKKIGIDIQLIGNYPWIYVDTINSKRVTERYHGNHGYTIGFFPIRTGQEFEFLDISDLFTLIRKYK